MIWSNDIKHAKTKRLHDRRTFDCHCGYCDFGCDINRGLKERAENSQTLSAASDWVEAMKLYKIDNENFPDETTCLGKIDTCNGDGKCWTGSNRVVKSGFLTKMSDYLSDSYPRPSTKYLDIPYRGILYVGGTYGEEEAFVNILGISDKADCPDISGLKYTYGYVRTEGVSCRYDLVQ